MRTAQFGLIMSGILVAVAPGGPVSAAAENLPWSDGGSGASNFQVQKDSACSGSGSGLGYRDDDSYGFDQGAVLTVGGTIVGSGATSVDVTTSGNDSIATYTETLGDFTVVVSYRFTDDDIARTLVTITNNGASAAVAVPVTLAYNHGDTFTVRSVDGGTWRNSGNWFVQSESGVPTNQIDNYNAVFHFPDGPGSPESMASIITCIGGSVNVNTDAEEIAYGYIVDIPAGESRRILVFNGLANTADAVTTKAGSFASSVPLPGSGILGDLSEEDACTVVNWEFCSSGGGSSYEVDIDISNYLRESDLPDTE